VEEFDDPSDDDTSDDKYNIDGHFIETSAPIYNKTNSEKPYPPHLAESEPLSNSKV